MPSGPPRELGNLFGPGIQKSQCSKMAMRMGLALEDEVAG
mgnify:FL=1